MKLLVFGQTGQVARELQALTGPGLEIVTLGRDLADFTDPFDPVTRIEDTGAEAVIIAAAYTNVDGAEGEEALATTVNATAPGAIARACAAWDLPLINISTDYVFDGSGDRPHAPDEATAPINAYGRSKLAGEDAVRAAGGTHVILRTSWVFSAHGSNFVKTMLRLSETRDALSVVNDQIGGPTPAEDIAHTLVTIARGLVAGHPGGTYHYAGAPATSWAGFAREIFRLAQKKVEISDIFSQDYPTPARRPLNSRLDCASLETDFGIKLADWKAGLARVIRDLEQV